MDPPSGTGPSPRKPVIAPHGPSPLLSRLQHFLPAMETANLDLLQRPPNSVSMELNEEDERPHIAMDLNCGLFELTTAEMAERAERVMHGTALEGSAPPSDDESPSDSDMDSEVEAAQNKSPARPGRQGGEEAKNGSHLGNGLQSEPPSLPKRTGRALVGEEKNLKMWEI